jgi:tetraacyldisaccharide 4'-kinase
VGGSGKTPIAADIAARLTAAGIGTAVVTHGFMDEMDVHRKLSPECRVYGGSDRLQLARKAAEEGARLVILDSGFQHRRLHRDLDILTLDERTLGLRLAHLPAGPYREGLESLARADVVVIVRRDGPESEGPLGPISSKPAAGRSLVDRLVEVSGSPPIVAARIRPGSAVAVNEAARGVPDPAPALAVAGIMWPEVFFAQAKVATSSVRESVALADHARFEDALADSLRKRAGESGIICTLKDAMKLVRAVGDDVPVWYLSEEVEWERPDATPIPVLAALALVSTHARDPDSEGTS